MGIIVSKDQDKNADLTRRITADLREKSSTALTSNPKTPDLAEDSEYLKDFKKTNKFGWIWAVLIVLALASLVLICIL